MTRTIFIAAALALAVTMPSALALTAAAPRTFVSAAGSDSNNCTNVATPCRHMAAAFAATAPDGEIYVLDPANYGSLTITHGVSIEGHGWASIAPPSGTNTAAITITATGATDKINIVGVVLDGTGLANTAGIEYNSGGTLTVSDSVIRNFGLNGIFFGPASSTTNQLYVSNTLISDNSGNAIAIGPFGSGNINVVLDHVKMVLNQQGGLSVFTSSQIINVTVSDSVSANNGGDGIAVSASSGGVNAMVRNSAIANNINNGLSVVGGTQIWVTRSAITGNGNGWNTDGVGTISSYADNNIDGNTTGNTAPPPVGYK